MLGHRPLTTPLLHCSVLMLYFCIPAQPQSSRGSRRHLKRIWGPMKQRGAGSGRSRASVRAYTGGGDDGTTVQKLHEGSHRSARAIRDWGSDLFLCLQVSGLGSWLLVGHSGGGAAETPHLPGCGPGRGMKWGVQSPAPPLSGPATPGLHAFTAW